MLKKTKQTFCLSRGMAAMGKCITAPRAHKFILMIRTRKGDDILGKKNWPSFRDLATLTFLPILIAAEWESDTGVNLKSTKSQRQAT